MEDLFVWTCCRLRPSLNCILISSVCIWSKQTSFCVKTNMWYTNIHSEIQAHIKKTILTACKTNYFFGLKQFSSIIYRLHLFKRITRFCYFYFQGISYCLLIQTEIQVADFNFYVNERILFHCFCTLYIEFEENFVF